MSASFLKKLAALTVTLVAIWVAYLYQQVPHQEKPFDKAVDSAEQITLEQGTKKVQLSKRAGTWRVMTGTGEGMTADEDTVKEFLSSLERVQLEDEISSREDRAAEFELDTASGTRVRLQYAKESRLAEGIFGKQAPDITHIFFRYPSRPTVYLARGLMRGDVSKLDPAAWRSRDLVRIPENQIQKIQVESGGQKMDFVRVSSEAWSLNGKPAAMDTVNSLLGTLAHLRGDDFVDPVATPGLSYDKLKYARVIVAGKEPSTELHVGFLDSKTKRYPASVGIDSGAAWLSRSTVESILQIKR